ncbi:hypothetical protein [Polaribacter sp. SA4-12]|uniref:hypothetical protein n=1 Tax=Polaribacter sp. SA4-12 TaxID=1312072 RepID=UPI000B57EEAB|nr:hypothetical protein [Polaribacter sp. SA4-12]ARV15787.1 hypothetical protein BTO07_11850 [Polaribacter sp. SA4-12]
MKKVEEKKMKIAGNLTIDEWNELKEKLKPENDELWGLGAHFFEERIKTRYLTPIHAIQNLNLNEGEGFAMVNLQCSLIETFECFINGWMFDKNKWWKETGCKEKILVVKDQEGENIKNGYIFEQFFKDFSDSFDNINGGDFYSKVRCGLLHETQTKGNWIIRVAKENNDKCYEYDDGNNIIYRNNFQEKLEELLEEYSKAIADGKKFEEIGISIEDLRKNFRTKMNHICKQSEL